MGTTKKSGFTILELVIVLALVAAMASIVVFKRSQTTKTVTASPAFKGAEPSATPNYTADPMAGWQIYSSSVFGYQLKYPSDWTIKRGNDASIYGAFATSFTSPATTAKMANINGMNTSVFADLAIAYYPSITDTYGGLGGAQPKTLQELSAKLQSPETITVGGENGYAGIAQGDVPAYQVLLENSGHIYMISFIGSGNTSKASLASTEQEILSSFTFDAPTASPVVTTKTYTNNRVGYTFQYPASGLSLDLDETITYPSTMPGDSNKTDLVQFAKNGVTYSVRTTVGVAPSISSWTSDGLNIPPTELEPTTIAGTEAEKRKNMLASFVVKNASAGNNIGYEIVAHKGIAASTDLSDPIYASLISSFQFTN